MAAPKKEDPGKTAISYPNKSPAIFRGNKHLRQGTKTIDIEVAKGLHDTRTFPEEKNNKGQKNLSPMAVPYREHLFPLKNLRNAGSRGNSWSVDVSDPSLLIWKDTEGGQRSCARLRATSRFNDAGTWRRLADVEEFKIEDDEERLKSIPPELAHLRSLRILTLNWSPLKFVGPEVAHLELTQLYLQRNKLENIDPVCEIKSLTVLSLAHNNIQELPLNIGNLNYLRELDVCGNKLREIPETIARLELLKELNVSSNRLVSLTSSIGKLTDVASLDIAGNRLREIPNEIGAMESLAYLIASNNQFAALPGALSSCTQLKEIYLRMNQFIDVPHVLSKLPALRLVNLKDNFIERMEISIEPLRTLILDNNNFEEIPETVFGSPHLEHLSIIGNTITDIPLTISTLTRLRSLYLASNEITNIPHVMVHLLQLRHLSLEDNNITDILVGIHHLQKLNVLVLDKGKLRGNWSYVYGKGIAAVKVFSARLERGSVVVSPQKKTETKADSGLESCDDSQHSEIGSTVIKKQSSLRESFKKALTKKTSFRKGSVKSQQVEVKVEVKVEVDDNFDSEGEI